MTQPYIRISEIEKEKGVSQIKKIESNSFILKNTFFFAFVCRNSIGNCITHQIIK